MHGAPRMDGSRPVEHMIWVPKTNKPENSP